MEPINVLSGEVAENSSIPELIQRLAAARAEEAEADAEYKAALAEFETRNAAVINRRRNAKAAGDEAYRILVTAAEAVYEKAGDKRPHDAIEIKLVEKFTPGPGDAARQWTVVNMPALLDLNTARYEALFRVREQNKALAGLLDTMPGEMVVVAKAYVKNDLSAYLPQPASEAEAAK